MTRQATNLHQQYL